MSFIAAINTPKLTAIIIRKMTFTFRMIQIAVIVYFISIGKKPQWVKFFIV